MSIKVLFFGVLTDICKCNEEAIEATSLNELKQILFTKYPQLKEYKYNIAVNQQIVKKDIQLNKKDEVALLPPYSGG